jgi:hypothetical protein
VKTTRRRVEDAMKENREDRILLRGDFNGRIGERGARNWEVEKGGEKRKRESFSVSKSFCMVTFCKKKIFTG